ncbi:Bug family tripartite tricarboxylate transporter substrate binding protein [Hydrogenophaga sp. BPS33]|uniref:Bug family tripartite tricarboxylate transporter substrate binding protein n=1 Tax=Hydrogenophaga sp. BPS33 TaxID=2651974 RepID=UPI00131FE4F1|nr:tripartite tricarboxylate transporter substrate binding protein [Hydrogenophaga sp. BPS33]QHE83397.1 tripartite tricarboxylate transporter substrate binding protein [Hydrogenophaga sp. BPS33]
MTTTSRQQKDDRPIQSFEPKRRKFLGAMIAAGASFGVSASDRSQPFRVLVPIGPGSMSDTLVRGLTLPLGKELGQAVVVENLPGANGVIAVQALMRAPADGNSVMVLTPSTGVINELVNKDLPYSMERDFRLLSIATRGPMVLTVGAGSKYKTLQELMAEVRARPGSVTMGGYGDYFRISLSTMEQATGTRFTYVPYAGSAGSLITNLMQGIVDVAQMDPSSVLGLLKDRKLIALAVTGRDRSALLPDVPSMKELGVPYENYGWMAFGMRRNTPDDVARRVEVALSNAIKSPEFGNLVSRLGGNEVLGLSGSDATEFLAMERKRYAQAVNATQPNK